MASLTTVGLSLRFPTPPEIQLSLARKWLQDCQNSHQRCHLPQRRLPRRVIDVNPGHEPFLFESLGEFFGEWVALSHCWGTENTFKTTSETYASRCRGFRWEKLPKTFQDAVTVTRMLGVRYLWIDSICIIQDDGGEDFRHEANKMCDIYRESFLTIAAGRALGDTDGFLIPWTFSTLLRNSTITRNINHNEMQLSDPLHQRAWTFQEVILPRRVLTFGSAEMYWECEEHRDCECGKIEYASSSFDGDTIKDVGRTAYRKYSSTVIDGRQYIGQVSTFARYFDAFLSHASEPELQSLLAEENSMAPQKKNLELATFYRYWRTTLVPEFTQRKLSNVSDKLVALAAIASDIGLGTGDTYLAGLWKRDLVRGLLWESIGHGIPNIYSSKNVNGIPSWSWASVDSPVRQYSVPGLVGSFFRSESVRKSESLTISGAHCQTILDFPYGTVIGGSLEVTGKAFSAIMFLNSCSDPKFYYRIPEGITSESNQIANISISLDTPVPSHHLSKVIRSGGYGLLQDNTSEEVELLVIGKSKKSSSEVFLILSQQYRESQQVYLRIGIGHSPSLMDSPGIYRMANFSIV